MSIDVSTNQLCELAVRALSSAGGLTRGSNKVSVEQMLAIWHNVGIAVRSQLMQKKGVRLPSLGTFTFSPKGQPLFLMTTELSTQFHLHQPSNSVPTAASCGNAPTTMLNFSQVREGTGIPRDTVDKMYGKFIAVLGRCIAEGRSVLINVHRVAEISIDNGELRCDFTSQFLDGLSAIGNTTLKTGRERDSIHNRAKQAARTLTLQQQRGQRNGGYTLDDFGSVDDVPSVSRKASPRPQGPGAAGTARPQSAPRNPITGELQRPASAGRLNRTTNDAMGYNAQKQARRPGSASGRVGRPGSGGGARELAARAMLSSADVVEKVRRKIVERGGSAGIKGITRLLKIMDDNGDKRLSKDELRYGLRDYGIDLTQAELEQVFAHFDRDGNGFIDCTEFLVGLQGEMKESRRRFVQMAFNMLDKDRSGFITPDEILGVYDFTWHPSVREGKMTVKEAARDFMGQWDRKEKDGMISLEEFEDYYKELSASIDDDAYFELMMRNAWRISGGSGQAANTANKRVLVTNRDGSQRVATVEDELGMRGGDVDDVRRRLQRQGVDAADIELYGGVDTTKGQRPKGRGGPITGGAGDAFSQRAAVVARRNGRASSASRAQRSAPIEAWGGPASGDMGVAPPSAGARRGAPAKADSAVVDRVRTKILERCGGQSAGIKGMQRSLTIMDDNGDKRLTKNELKNGLADYGIELTSREIDEVFRAFDRDRNGTLDVSEFFIGLKGDMNEHRKNMVRMAFNILDMDGSGYITIDEMLDKYDFSHHPEVKTGKKTIEQAMREFMGQWDDVDGDGSVSYAEFEDYYKGLSASIDDDAYFELMMRNAWRISGGSGQAANTANKRVLVTNRDGSQRVATVEDELGMRGGDVDDVRRRLQRQGVDATDIELYGGVDTTKGQRPKGRGGPVGVGRGSMGNFGGPGPGDQHSAPRGLYSREAPTSGSRHREEFDPIHQLKDIIYNPPCDFDAFCIKLEASKVTNAPRLAQGAFVKRISTLNPTLTRPQLKAVWDAIDPNRRGVVEVKALYDMMSSKYGRNRGGDKISVIDRVRAKIIERCGGGGIKGLQRTLSIMDDNGDKKLTKEELKTGLADYGIELNMREMDEVFSFFDRDRNGTLDVSEFLIGVKGDMNEHRKNMVRMAFNILDTDGSGYITIDEMLDKYDFSHHPEVKTGKKTIEQAMREFMGQWDDVDGDGSVSYAEFEDYYKGLSASIDGDDYFELMIRNAWRIAGGKGQAANTANKRVLVTNRDGSQRVATVEDELGMRGGDVDDVRRRLQRQGIDAADIELYGGVDTTKGQRPKGRGGEQMGVGGTVPLPTRHAAAAKLAAAYRGRAARQNVAQQRRYQQVQEEERLREAEEANRPRARQINRPKGKSYIGF